MSEQFNKSPLAAITGVINRLPGSLNLNQCCCALIVPETLVAAVTGANLLALTEHSHKNIPNVFLHPSGRIQELFFFYPHVSLKVASTKLIPGYWTRSEIWELIKHQEKLLLFNFILPLFYNSWDAIEMCQPQKEIDMGWHQTLIQLYIFQGFNMF